MQEIQDRMLALDVRFTAAIWMSLRRVAKFVRFTIGIIITTTAAKNQFCAVRLRACGVLNTNFITVAKLTVCSLVARRVIVWILAQNGSSPVRAGPRISISCITTFNSVITITVRHASLTITTIRVSRAPSQ
jgi:hypothetical protein